MYIETNIMYKKYFGNKMYELYCLYNFKNNRTKFMYHYVKNNTINLKRGTNYFDII